MLILETSESGIEKRGNDKKTKKPKRGCDRLSRRVPYRVYTANSASWCSGVFVDKSTWQTCDARDVATQVQPLVLLVDPRYGLGMTVGRFLLQVQHSPELSAGQSAQYFH